MVSVYIPVSRFYLKYECSSHVGDNHAGPLFLLTLEYILQHVEVASSSNAAAAAAFSHYNNRKTSKHFMTALTFQYEAKSLHRSFIVTWR